MKAFIDFIFFYFIGRHTGANIKNEYDDVIKFFDLKNKVFKVVTDQAANMKKAFQHETEAADSDELQILVNELLLNQKKEDAKKRDLLLREELEKSIDLANHVEPSISNDNRKKLNREAALAELILDDSLVEVTDPSDELDCSNETLNDPSLIPSLDDLVNEFLFDDEISIKLF